MRLETERSDHDAAVAEELFADRWVVTSSIFSPLVMHAWILGPPSSDMTPFASSYKPELVSLPHRGNESERLIVSP
jgi:hypothetical protein